MKPAHAAIAAALFLVVDYGRMLNGTHHWFSVLAVMGALAALLKARTPPRIVIAGALLGVASLFYPDEGPDGGTRYRGIPDLGSISNEGLVGHGL